MRALGLKGEARVRRVIGTLGLDPHLLRLDGLRYRLTKPSARSPSSLSFRQHLCVSAPSIPWISHAKQPRRLPERHSYHYTVVPITGVTRATTTVMVDTGQAGNKTSSALPPSVVPPGRTPLSSSDTSLKLVLPPRSVRLNVKSGQNSKDRPRPCQGLGFLFAARFLVSRSHGRTL